MAKPPEYNPMPAAARARRHWADAHEIAPGYWAVYEGISSKSSSRHFAVVRPTASRWGWAYTAYIRRRYGLATLHIPGLQGQRSWRIDMPVDDIGKLIESAVAIIKEYG